MSARPIRLEDAKTPEERQRWARWAVRFFARFLTDDERAARGLPRGDGALPPLFTVARGGEIRFTPLAIMAERWGVHAETFRQAADIARRGYRMLDELKK